MVTNNHKVFVITILLTVLICIGIPVLCLDQFRINGPSMAPTFSTGDHVLVNKTLFGARIYTRYDFKNPEMRCIRIPGIRSIQAGDIVVFNCPEGRGKKKIEFKINYVYAKRCIGAPGDIIGIDNGIYYNRTSDLQMPLEFQSYLRTNTDSLLIEAGVTLRTGFHPKNSVWSIRDFGPVTIPAKGHVVQLSEENIPLYSRAIEFETGYMPEVKDGDIILNGTHLKEYRFSGNWYFFGGDNVTDSKDSRYFGFVPESYIVGIVSRQIWHNRNN